MEDRDTWQTPQWLFDKLDEIYHFKFDCCASKENRKTINFSDNFLDHNVVVNNGWMNPPFSKPREMFEKFFDICFSGVAIYRCDNMETAVWQEIIFKKASWIAIPKGRIKYDGFKGNGSRFPSALIGYKVKKPLIKDWVVLEMTKEKEELATSLIPKPGFILIQCAMLFLHYGMEYNMPWWVVWFPSIIYGVVIAIVLLILLIIAVGAAIMD